MSHLYFVVEPGRIDTNADTSEGSCTYIGTYNDIEIAKEAFKNRFASQAESFVQKDRDFKDFLNVWWTNEILSNFPVFEGKRIDHFWGYGKRNGYIAPWYGVVFRT